jgi:hypothetical protein
MRAPPSPSPASGERATFNAADSPLWLTMRTDAVALATPSKCTSCSLLDTLPPMRMESASDSPLYWDTNWNSDASPSPSRNTGS